MKERLAATGLRPFRIEEGLGALEAAMSVDMPQVGVVAADWAQFLARSDKDLPPSPYFAAVRAAGGRPETPGSDQRPIAAFRDRLEAAAPGRRPALLRNIVRETSLRVLGLTEANGPADSAPLSEFGLDSLLAVELRNALGKSLGMALSATLLFDHPTIEALSEFLWNEICNTGVSNEKRNVSDRVADLAVGSAMLAEIAELSDAEVETLLGARRQ